jgi:anhydro-N-acetylmuramic acid kinase
MEVDYDSNGDISRKGKLIKDIYNDLNALAYYKETPPKSLGLEWVNENFMAILDDPKYKTEDLMNTCVQHIAYHINWGILEVAGRSIDTSKKINILVTGGGAYNQFLIENLRKGHDNLNYILPDREIIDYKEAIIFAFLGVLRLNKQVNILNTATGARTDSIGGTLHDNLKP